MSACRYQCPLGELAFQTALPVKKTRHGGSGVIGEAAQDGVISAVSCWACSAASIISLSRRTSRCIDGPSLGQD